MRTHTDVKKHLRTGLFCFISLVSGPIILTGCGESPAPGDGKADSSEVQSSLKRGFGYLQQGQYRAAMIESRNALQNDPNNTDAKLLLANVYNQLGRSKQALEILNSIQTKDLTDSPRVILSKLTAYENLNKFDSSLSLINKYANVDFGKEQFDLLVHKAKAQMGSKQLSEAEATLKSAQALTVNSTNKAAKLSLAKARIELIKNDPDKAIEYLDQSVASEPMSDALVLRASISFINQKYEEAEDFLTQALLSLPDTDVITPTRARILEGLVQILTKQGRSAEAMIYSKVLADANPEGQTLRNKFDEAIELYKSGKLAEAEKLLLDIYGASSNDAAGRLLGLINFSQGDLEQANTFFSEHIDPETASPQALRLLSETQLRLNKPEDVLNSLKQKIEQNPDNPDILAIYGLAALSQNSAEEGIKAIERALVLDPKRTRLRVALADHYAKNRDIKKGIDELEKAFIQSPGDSAIQQRLVKSYIATNNTKEAVTFYKKVLEMFPKESQSFLLAGSVEDHLKNTEKALEFYIKSKELDNKSLGAKYGIAKASLASGDAASARSELETIIKLDPDQFPAYYILIQATPGDEERKALLSKLESTSKKNLQTWAPTAVLGHYYSVSGDLEKAKEFIDEALIRNPSAGYTNNVALSLYKQLAQRSVQAGKASDGRQYLLEALQLTPNDAEALFSLTSIEINENNLSEAEKLIAQVSETYPGSVLEYAVKAEYALKTAKKAEAITLLTEGWSKTYSELLANKLYPLVKDTWNHKEKVEFLNQWSAKNPKSPASFTLLGMELQETGQSKKAITAYEQSLAINPKNPLVLNNLAWLLFEAKSSKAEEIAKLAYDLLPANAAIADTYGWILHNNEKKAEAIEILSKALALDPNAKEIQDHLAEAKK